MSETHAPSSFHSDWEALYGAGFNQNWPWDVVVSFVYRHAPRGRVRADIRILELGFGAGANLWFAAREGFSVAGIEGSQTAVARARARFAAEGLTADLRTGDFTAPLDFPDASFDLVIDRAALTYAGVGAVRAAVAQVRRVLRADGYLFFSPYASDHPAARQGVPYGDGRIERIRWPGLRNMGPISFWSEADVTESFGAGCELTGLSHMSRVDRVGDNGAFSAWYAIARKVGA